jgi:hypothetical protein
MDSNKCQEKKKNTEKGRIKGTSAFNIQQAEKVDEISWSNNKFESTYSSENNKLNNKSE